MVVVEDAEIEVEIPVVVVEIEVEIPVVVVEIEVEIPVVVVEIEVEILAVVVEIHVEVEVPAVVVEIAVLVEDEAERREVLMPSSQYLVSDFTYLRFCLIQLSLSLFPLINSSSLASATSISFAASCLLLEK